MCRYEIVGPKMNPVSAMCYRVWDKKKGEYVKYQGKYAEEFLTKEDALKKIEDLNE